MQSAKFGKFEVRQEVCDLVWILNKESSFEYSIIFRMKIVKEHNEMTEGLEAKKRALLTQLEMVFSFLFTSFYIKK